MHVSGKQIRAARVLLGWDRSDLAKHSGLSTAAIHYIENEESSPKRETIEKIAVAFRNAGVEFIENEGVRRAPIGVEIFEGRDRFNDFLIQVEAYLEQFGGDVFASITNECAFQKAVKNIEAYRKKMLDLAKTGKIRGRILAADGNFKRTWADLRRQKKIIGMPDVSFYAYGDNLALISFDHQTPPYVVLHKAGPFAAAYRFAFDAAWKEAEIVE
ncbi:MAG: helix-turn-helix transcriptional regulator [Alphaproteobacteria bacterium]|nr:helix-turn-helix transcriptional regulator [Alphaproteobacteria bacterium]